ncbi:inositol-pentakisphosphate 2-kinase-like isoform X2 [Punica granatum]|uniref:Inositol-pentakisphosphate 2-kinase n=1 Tax=Punica granatum TaxID=22663 RepID=A0A6P8DT51_PUNGR|nr:inositol-pentakisphosphate 2-kinase-like isoform X2 [Punica granatum]
MDQVLEERDAADWVYRGEGAANIVVAYTGSSPALAGKVLRIQKVPEKESNFIHGSAFSANERLLWKDHKELVLSPTRDMAAQLYLEHVMSPLLGSKHVDAGEFLEAVEENINGRRPVWRINAAKVNRDCKHALLLSDHSCFPRGIMNDEPCISIEIKPKCGFLPSSRYIAKRNAIKRSITRFKMHQALKFHDKEVSKISDYDPLDLFSGSKDRMYKALKALYDTPQNNFRVFMDGSLILGDLGGSADSTTRVIGENLEDVLKSIIQADDGLRTRRFLELIIEAVRKSGVLDRLLDVQKLDTYNIEGAIHAYYNIVSRPCIVCKELGEDGWFHKRNSLHSLSLEESLKIVKDFLISATVKDCSLMICFRPRGAASDSSFSSVHLESTGQFFDYKAFFIDLDLKPLDKMEHYYKLDQKIVRWYTQIARDECSDKRDGCIELYSNTN